MPLTDLVYCVTVKFKMTERADQLHHDNGPAHSTALVQAFYFILFIIFFFEGRHITQVCQTPYSKRFGALRLLPFPKAKIPVEREVISECDGHTVHKLSQRRLTAD